jgi:SAM-dependent methyltransferase
MGWEDRAMSTEASCEIKEGHYYRKQIACESRIISWSHRSRFAKAVELAGRDPSGCLLDYGCGDGTFLAMTAGNFAACVGADVAEDQVSDCRRRFVGVPGVSFRLCSELGDPDYDRSFSVVACMETLEHCTEPAFDRVLSDLRRLCAPTGRIIISVPIEIGPSFLIKYAVRKAAAMRGLSDYRHYENYTLRDATRMVFATRRTAIDRPTYGGPGPEGCSHSHYGFNWRRLRERVADRFDVDRTEFTPLGRLGELFGSQAWFVCRPR